jgi:hypothetical protein
VRTNYNGCGCLFRCFAAQIRAGLDASPSDRAVYETDKWDPCKPFVTDKVGPWVTRAAAGTQHTHTHLAQ